MKKLVIEAQIPTFCIKEGDVFIIYTPAFDLAAHGDSFADAERSFHKSLKLFIDYVTEKGTWEEVLKEYGWKKNRKSWFPPEIIKQESIHIKIPLVA